MPTISDLNEVDVIVIGAGITGLSTAYAVQKAGYNVVVVEKSAIVGGRIITREWNGDKVEVGQQYLLSTYTNALALVDELGMKGDLVVEGARVIQHIDEKGESHLVDSDAALLRLLGVRGAADLARATMQFSSRRKSFASYDFDAYFEEYDNVSAEEGFAWAGDRFRDFVLRPMCYGSAGCSLDQISLFDAVRLFRSQLKKPIHYGFRHGNVSLPLRLAEKVPVMLNAKVEELSLDGSRVSGVSLADGRKIKAGHVIVCTTPDAAAKLTPSHVSRAKKFLGSFNHTPLALVFLHLNRPLQSAAVSFGIAAPGERYFNMSINHSITRPFLVPSGNGVISAWTACPSAPHILSQDDQAIIAQALEELKLYYPGFSPHWVDHSEVVRHDWGYALQRPGNWKALMSFQDEAYCHEGLSYANADYSFVALESGVITGQKAADHAIASLGHA